MGADERSREEKTTAEVVRVALSEDPISLPEHEALVVDTEGRQFPATVLDLSSGGFRLRADETLKIGEYVALRVTGYGDFSAQIRWALGNEAGGVFLDKVNLPTD